MTALADYGYVLVMQNNQSYSDTDMIPIGAAAKLIGITAQTLRRWESAGLVEAIRTAGNQRRFRVRDLRKWLG